MNGRGRFSRRGGGARPRRRETGAGSRAGTGAREFDGKRIFLKFSEIA